MWRDLSPPTVNIMSFINWKFTSLCLFRNTNSRVLHFIEINIQILVTGFLKFLQQHLGDFANCYQNYQLVRLVPLVVTGLVLCLISLKILDVLEISYKAWKQSHWQTSEHLRCINNSHFTYFFIFFSVRYVTPDKVGHWLISQECFCNVKRWIIYIGSKPPCPLHANIILYRNLSMFKLVYIAKESLYSVEITDQRSDGRLAFGLSNFCQLKTSVVVIGHLNVLIMSHTTG